MPKKINKTIGECLCVTKHCTVKADIRRIKNEGNLYLDCSECGSLRLRGQNFQDYILENGTFYTPENLKPSPGYPCPVPEPGEEGQEKKDVKNNNVQDDGSENTNFQTEPLKTKKGFLTSLNDFEL